MVVRRKSLRSKKTLDGKGIKDIEERTCTDVCSLCVFILFWVGMVAIGLNAVSTGDLQSLYLGSDYMGNRCGAGDYLERRHVYYPRLSQDLYEQFSIMKQGSWFTMPALYGLCVESCPSIGSDVDDYGYGFRNSGAMKAYWHVPIRTFSTLNRCMPHITANRSVTRFCVDPPCSVVGEKCVDDLTMLGLPQDAWLLHERAQLASCGRELELEQVATTKQPNSNAAFDQLLQLNSLFEAAYESVVANRMGVALFGVALPLGLGFAWMLFLFLCSGIAVSLVLTLLGLLLLGATLLFGYKGGVGGELMSMLVNVTVDQFHELEARLDPDYQAFVEDALSSAAVQEALQVEEEMRAVYQTLAGECRCRLHRC